jgi:head-tail adaptor
MIDPGRLDRRLILEEPVDTPDGAGGYTRTYQTAATLWAQVMPAAARGDVTADSLGATVAHRIVIRAGPDVTTRHRLRDGDRVLRIVSARKQDVRGLLLVIHAEERRD